MSNTCEMSIDAVKNLKSKLEDTIREEVASFHQKTGLRVTSLDLLLHEARTWAAAPAFTGYEVRVRAEL